MRRLGDSRLDGALELQPVSGPRALDVGIDIDVGEFPSFSAALLECSSRSSRVS
jgi:hypothetical protein